jgi:NhaP-type Na+/H+ or K+/H+ antiporter
MPFIVENIARHSQAELLGWAMLVSAAVIGIRLAPQFIIPYLIRAGDRRPSQIAPRLPWQQRLVLGWCGTRGAISFAAALALPLERNAGAPFLERSLLIFLTFTVILRTVIG